MTTNRAEGRPDADRPELAPGDEPVETDETDENDDDDADQLDDDDDE